MRVERLWRYPVKSFRGERRDAVEIDARGVVGDRLFAVRTANGRFGSGKTTRRFARVDGLLDLSADQPGDLPDIVLPDAKRFAVDDPAAARALSDWLGQPVELVREAAVPHMDAGPIHLLTTASLSWLQAELPGCRVVAERFRPNLLIDRAGAEPIEQRDWIGATLRIGDDVVLRVVEPTERCRMVDLAQADLPAERELLRHLARHWKACFGVYVEVLATGTIRCGDPVALDDDRRPSRASKTGIERG
jgi:uncharacterized protein YcbX